MEEGTPDNPVVGVLGIIRRGDRLLVIQRSQSVRSPLTWCFPGGHIEPGETQPEALVREMREELHIDVQPDGYLTTQVKRGGALVLHCWSATVIRGEPTANPAEIAEAVWMTPEEIRRKDGVLDGTTALLEAVGR
jgi:8-oxo-dGTP pyrophosphatase MutT (NUDIX family)